MTPMFAHVLAIMTIVAISAVAATIIVSLLPARLRTAIPILIVGSLATATVAFGTDLADTLPDRIVATHAASDTLEALHKSIPHLDQLTEADPLVEYELSSAFHTAYLAADGSAEERARRAGHAFGLAVEQAFLRALPNLSDGSAQRLIELERQMLEVRAETDPASCGVQAAAADSPAGQPDERLAILRRAVLRAKVQALVDGEQGSALFDFTERAAFEAQLLAEAASRPEAGDSPCARLIAFYAMLQQQPGALQGRWVRSRQMFPIDG